MNIQDYKGVFVFAQQVDNVLGGIALELVREKTLSRIWAQK